MIIIATSLILHEFKHKTLSTQYISINKKSSLSSIGKNFQESILFFHNNCCTENTHLIKLTRIANSVIINQNN